METKLYVCSCRVTSSQRLSLSFCCAFALAPSLAGAWYFYCGTVNSNHQTQDFALRLQPFNGWYFTVWVWMDWLLNFMVWPIMKQFVRMFKGCAATFHEYAQVTSTNKVWTEREWVGEVWKRLRTTRKPWVTKAGSLPPNSPPLQ